MAVGKWKPIKFSLHTREQPRQLFLGMSGGSQTILSSVSRSTATGRCPRKARR